MCSSFVLTTARVNESLLKGLHPPLLRFWDRGTVGAGGQMDIHKPKAAHSLREFAVEIGTIICGILIALGLEQVVEAVHRGAEVGEAREALRRDIAEHMQLLAIEVREDRCSIRRLAAYRAWANGGARPAVAPRNYSLILSSVWDVSRPAVALMPLEERIAFSKFYGLAVNFNMQDEALRLAAHRIGEFYGVESLTGDDGRALLKATREFEQDALAEVRSAEHLLQVGAATGAKAPPIPAEAQHRIDKSCAMADAAASP